MSSRIIRRMFVYLAALVLTGAIFTGCGNNGKTEKESGKTEDFTNDLQKGNRTEDVGKDVGNHFAGTGKDRIAELWRKATEENDSDAQIELGVCYQTGDGVECDMTKSAEWFRKAAELGDFAAQRNLGYLYLKGKGVEKDKAEARKWLEKAAAQGDTCAADLLKEMN